ncbi:MAG: hypothetical protein A4S09_07925 [Proteobacteria bacterium SG_bin7]|nr:MAG: hypothetical protein A4S09_07925 [Proteobacteria bacterium SG_bin7]
MFNHKHVGSYIFLIFGFAIIFVGQGCSNDFRSLSSLSESEEIKQISDTEPPSMPTGLTATAISSSQINLSWMPSTDNVGVVSYSVYRNGLKITTVTGNSYSDNGLVASTSYIYAVAGHDAQENTSPLSQQVSKTTLDVLPPNIGMVPVIVAQGFMGRTTISCDDGVTWINNRSFDLEGSYLVTPPGQAPKAVRCDADGTGKGATACYTLAQNGSYTLSPVCDCGHSSGFGKGVVVANGTIYANFGWGGQGALIGSTDGKVFKEVRHESYAGYSNILYGLGKFVLYDVYDNFTSIDGINWVPAPNYPGPGARAVAFYDYGNGGRFVAAVDGNVMHVSSDGINWHSVVPPANCTQGIGQAQKIAVGNGIAVMTSWQFGTSCSSSDGGETWKISPIVSGDLLAHGMLGQTPGFANGKFLASYFDFNTGQSYRYSSVDGIKWVADKSNAFFGPNGVSMKGSLIMTNGGMYENQFLYRSTDNGITWKQIPTSNYIQGHGFTRFESGYIPANTLCK